ncbi:MAG: 2-oxoacid:acceptor oxidoreductase family protein [Pseudomonadota bacterium]
MKPAPEQDTQAVLKHPKDDLLRGERIPHIFCSGCGIGTVVSSLVEVLHEQEEPHKNIAMVSGIGCSSRVPGYLRLDGFHTTHGRSIPYATGLKLTNPDLKVCVFAGDGDLASIGGNHLIQAARRNMDLKVICVNNFNYGMTGGQGGPTTPTSAWSSTTVYGNIETPFNLIHLMIACGASYAARWTSIHTHYVKVAMTEMFEREGFCFLEVIAPCPTNYGRKNRLGVGSDMVKYFLDHSIAKVNPDPAEALIQFGTPIICGKFLDTHKTGHVRRMTEHLSKKLKVPAFRGDGRVKIEEGPVAAPKTPARKQLDPATRPNIDRVQIKIAGVGGQGLGLSGFIMGRAAAIFDGNQVVYTQEYSPEARGGASSSSLVLSQGRIHMPYVTRPDILIIIAQQAWEKYLTEITPGCSVLIDSELVDPHDMPEGGRLYKIPCTRMAEELGRIIVANIVMLGYFSSLFDCIRLEAMKEALKMSIPKGTEEFNLKAFETGHEYGRTERAAAVGER